MYFKLSTTCPRKPLTQPPITCVRASTITISATLECTYTLSTAIQRKISPTTRLDRDSAVCNINISTLSPHDHRYPTRQPRAWRQHHHHPNSSSLPTTLNSPSSNDKEQSLSISKSAKMTPRSPGPSHPSKKVWSISRANNTN